MERPSTNVADSLATVAARTPDQLALIEAWGKHRAVTLRQLDDDATRLAMGLVAMGVEPGVRLALLVKPSIEFVTLVFALLRSGATMVLVDGGLGRKSILRSLESTRPDGFVAIPLAQALRVMQGKRFASARLNVTVGRRWFWRGETLQTVRRLGDDRHHLPLTQADDPAAIVFTSGSTGPPKGVVYRHETFTTQLAEIQRMYGLAPGGVDMACFPLFGLFNVAQGITTVLPEMDFSRPASADPHKLLAAAHRYRVTQSFASPAVWDRLSRHCEQAGETIPTLRHVFSCGAPVPARVMERTLKVVHPEAQMHTPYGATECLPVSTIEAVEVLRDTAPQTALGAGVCVGRKVASLEWRVIRTSDGPLTTIDQTESLGAAEVGELIVRGPQVSRTYADPAFNALTKITDGDSVWHRIGDVGYFDAHQRFWYCGRTSQRVVTSSGTLYTECVEGVINSHPAVRRSALVGIGGGEHPLPAVVVQLESGISQQGLEQELLQLAHSHDCSRLVQRILFYSELPTDIRHNAKIEREKLAAIAKDMVTPRG